MQLLKIDLTLLHFHIQWININKDTKISLLLLKEKMRLESTPSLILNILTQEKLLKNKG